MDRIRIGLLGCGTVGTGVVRILASNRADIEARLGVPVQITRIAVGRLDAERDPVVPRELLTDDPRLVTDDPEIQVVVEVIGGYEPARAHILRALAQGKHVVTANKALLARHGAEVFEAADAAGRDVIFEASVGGGIPVIRMLREGLAADRVRALHAIINGTSNFILTRMTSEGASYEEALAEAKELGYAEADPTMDVGGADAAQKLAILMALAYGLRVDPERILTEGIGTLTAIDIDVAERFGFTIRPLAVALCRKEGIEARVHPALVPSSEILASVQGVFNAVRVDSDALGPVLFWGQGAGMLPTAQSVVADVIELGRNILRGTSGRLPHLAFHADRLPPRRLLEASEIRCPWYLRFPVRDEPGVLGTIASILGARGISIGRMIQDHPAKEADGSDSVQVVMLTHEAREGDVRAALGAIGGSSFMVGEPAWIRIVEGA